MMSKRTTMRSANAKLQDCPFEGGREMSTKELTAIVDANSRGWVYIAFNDASGRGVTMASWGSAVRDALALVPGPVAVAEATVWDEGIEEAIDILRIA